MKEDLLDYITNLQQENERLKEKENKLQEKFKDWKRRIEKERKHYLCDRADCCGRIKDSKKYRSLYQENERLNNIVKETRQMLYKRMLDDYDTYTANVVCDFQSDFEEIIRLNGGDEE